MENYDQIRDFKGIWIPKNVWLNKDLSLQEKVILVEIDSLDNAQGCFATNAYFAEFFNLSKTRVSEIINSLIKKDYVCSYIIYKPNSKEIEKRILHINKDIMYSEKKDTPFGKVAYPTQDSGRPSSGKCNDNNTTNNTINNTNDNNTNSEDHTDPPIVTPTNNNVNAKQTSLVDIPKGKSKTSKGDEYIKNIAQQFIDHFNMRMGKKLSVTNDRLKCIKNLISQSTDRVIGINELKSVLDWKIVDWHISYSKEFDGRKYLRDVDTITRYSKFMKYLDEVPEDFKYPDDWTPQTLKDTYSKVTTRDNLSTTKEQIQQDQQRQEGNSKQFWDNF